MNAIMLKKKIKTYQKRKQLTNNKDNKKLEKPFLSKARKNGSRFRELPRSFKIKTRLF